MSVLILDKWWQSSTQIGFRSPWAPWTEWTWTWFPQPWQEERWGEILCQDLNIKSSGWCLLCCLWLWLLSLCLRPPSRIWPLRSPLWKTSSWGLNWTHKWHRYNKHFFRLTLITDTMATDIVMGMGMVMATMFESEICQIRIERWLWPMYNKHCYPNNNFNCAQPRFLLYQWY